MRTGETTLDRLRDFPASGRGLLVLLGVAVLLGLSGLLRF
jgi:hypothetical protein